jgi:soluble lytic murein transglycosylase-like protein
MFRTGSRVVGVIAIAIAGIACAPDAEDRAKREVLEQFVAEHAPDLDPNARRAIVHSSLAAERRHGVDAFLLVAVAERESHFRPTVRSPRGARGLMQVQPETAVDVATRHGIPWSGPDDLYDPETGIPIAAAYLAELEATFGDRRLALAAYHRGPTRVRRIVARGGTVKSRYAERVLKRVGELQQRLGGA